MRGTAQERRRIGRRGAGRVVVLVGLLVGLTACARWSHPAGVTAALRASDEADCEQRASSSSSVIVGVPVTRGIVAGVPLSSTDEDQVGACMTARGYVRR